MEKKKQLLGELGRVARNLKTMQRKNKTNQKGQQEQSHEARTCGIFSGRASVQRAWVAVWGLSGAAWGGLAWQGGKQEAGA